MFDSDPESALVASQGNFSLHLLTGDETWMDERTSYPVHSTVLLPLLRSADACWVYGLAPEGPLWEAARDIVSPEKGKYRVATDGNPVAGRELFWNAKQGKRGTILISVPEGRLDSRTIFSHCKNYLTLGNFRAGHTASAITLARKLVEDARVVFCFSGSNGLQRMEVFAAPPLAAQLFRDAREVCPRFNEAG